MPSLSAIGQAAVRILGNMAYSSHVFAKTAGSVATVQTTGAVVFSTDGIMKSKAALSAFNWADDALKASTDLVASLANWLQPSGLDGAFYTQPANTTVYYVFAVKGSDASTVRVVQGLYSGQTPMVGINTGGGGKVPDVPDGFVPFGLMKVVTGATTFAPGTDNLDKASVTFTFSDLAVLGANDAP